MKALWLRLLVLLRWPRRPGPDGPPPEPATPPVQNVTCAREEEPGPAPGPGDGPPPATAPSPEAGPPPRPGRAPAGAAARDTELAGVWYFRRNILDHARHYFEAIHVLRRGDPDSYDLLRHTGAVLIPPGFDTEEATDVFKWPGRHRGFGAALIAGGHPFMVDGRCLSRLCYFQKYSLTPYAEVAGAGETYFVHVLYIFPHRRTAAKLPAICTFAVHVDPEGRTRLLKVLHEHTARFRHRHAKWGDGRKFSHVTQTSWGYPAWMKTLARENKVGLERIQRVMLGMFHFTYLMALQGDGNLRIALHDGLGATAVFGVDLLRTPYFFRDRERSTDDRGRRIFHIVKVHRRKGGSFVRSHFRGQRDFVWHGYRVHITMPDKHHVSLNACDIEAMDLDDARAKGIPGWGMRRTGRLLQRLLAR